MTKKLLSIALTVPMVCLTLACGGGTPEAEAPEAKAPEAPAADASQA